VPEIKEWEGVILETSIEGGEIGEGSGFGGLAFEECCGVGNPRGKITVAQGMLEHLRWEE